MPTIAEPVQSSSNTLIDLNRNVLNRNQWELNINIGSADPVIWLGKGYLFLAVE